MERREFVKNGAVAAASAAAGLSLSCAADNSEVGQEGAMETNEALADQLDKIFGDHMEAELAGDLDRTMETMTGNPHLVNVPSMVGGHGREGVRRFYAKRLIGQFFPPDVKFETISRTYSPERLVDELAAIEKIDKDKASGKLEKLLQKAA